MAVLLAVPALAAGPVTVTATDPASPANENNPQVQGSGAASSSTVTLYSDSSCTDGNELGSGTDVEFNGAGVTATVLNDSSTDIYADDGSGCSTTFVTYVEDSTDPAAPTVDETDPESPANENHPKLGGTAEDGSTVSLYTDANCTTPARNGADTGDATGTAAEFDTPGIAVTVADDSTTDFYATATDAAGNVSPCSAAKLTYVEDSTADPPTLTATTPASPANENNPKVTGTAEEGSTVKLYPTADCSGAPAVSGPESEFSAGGLTVIVGDDTTSTFYGTVTDVAGNVSACSTSSITYVEDSTAPAAPGFVSTNPASPANDNQPEIVGAAETGSTVLVFATPDCSGTPLAGGSESDFALSGLTVTVPDDSTTSFYASATDAAGNTSACSTDPITYVEDSTGPETRVTFAPGGKTRDRTPTFLFAVAGHEDGVSFECKLDDGPFKRCHSPKTYSRLSLRHHTFKVRAVDEAGNADLTPAGRGFRLVPRPRRHR